MEYFCKSLIGADNKKPMSKDNSTGLSKYLYLHNAKCKQSQFPYPVIKPVQGACLIRKHLLRMSGKISLRKDKDFKQPKDFKQKSLLGRRT